MWAVALREQLPVVPVPLLSPDADGALDLQRAANAGYDLVHYERVLDCAAPPPLNEAGIAWLNEWLAEKK
mgnify:FL=1